MIWQASRERVELAGVTGRGVPSRAAVDFFANTATCTVSTKGSVLTLCCA